MQDGCIFRVHLVVWKPLELLNELFVDLKNTAAILDRSGQPKQRFDRATECDCILHHVTDKKADGEKPSERGFVEQP